MKKIIALLLFALIRLIPVQAEEGINFFKGTFPEALTKAKEQNKLLFIDCYTTWCGPCKWMAAHVFTDESVANSFNKNFISVSLDMEKGEGLDIAKKYAIKNYPTFLWIDKNGNQVQRSVGSTDASNFLAIAGNARDPKNNLLYLQQQFESGNREPSLLLSYAGALKDAYDMRYQSVADVYFQAQPDNELASAANWKAILLFTPNINSHTYAAITKSLPLFYGRYGKDSVQNVLDQLALNSLAYAKQQKDSVLLKNAISKLKASDNKQVLKESMTAELDYYKGNKDYEKYTTLAHDYINHFFMDDATSLNAVCWTYFMHVNDKDKLAEAEKWIGRSVALEDKYYNTDTYANILNKMGKKKEAIEMTNHSIALAKQAGEDFSSTQELLNDLLKE